MDIRDSRVLILGGAGLVGRAVARYVAGHGPRTLVLASLRREEAEEAASDLKAWVDGELEVEARWGDIFAPAEMKDLPRDVILGDGELRRRLVDDMYGELTDEVFLRSALGRLLVDVSPSIVVDCVNTAGVLAYQNVFASGSDLLRRASEGGAGVDAVEQHLSTLYLPKLIRHVQVALEGMKRAGTDIYVKVGTSGTGGMGLNIPFTHSEERPSRVLLSKAGLAGAHTLLLYLMARTPGAPAVKEVKPTAAISWKSIRYGQIRKGGRPVERVDAVAPLPLDEAFGEGAERGYEELHRPLEGVFLDAGENGLFSLGEFETLTALGLMEFVTPEEIAEAVLREIRAEPTGLDVVSALDAATMGPTYRAGVLRSAALERMESLEEDHESRAVAYEMLGPPRLSKLLFEAALLRRVHGTLAEAARLDPDRTSREVLAVIHEDGDLRQRIVTIGLPILLPDGESVFRGPDVKVPAPEDPTTASVDDRLLDRGWVDLRPANWERWRERIGRMTAELDARPGVERGSVGDHEYGDGAGWIRPGRLAAWVFRYEDEGERIKR